VSFPSVDLTPVAFETLAGFDADDLDAALAVFRRSAERLIAGQPAQRPARPPPVGLLRAAEAALSWNDPPGAFFRRWFRPFHITAPGFLTAYYEPEIEARRRSEPGFDTPVLARPADLVTLNDAPLTASSGESLTSARRASDGALVAYPDRRAIETEDAAIGAAPIAYVRDAVELFLLQVQGSGRLRLADGETLTLTYDGRNGWPYTSIGKLLIAQGCVPEAEMSLARLKSTLRDLGLATGAPGRRLMQENRSYVFFRIDDSAIRRLGPIGGAGCALTPLRSIAIDRALWCYGLPFWIAARVPWEKDAETRLERLMIGQDTGSAIVGPARADLFFGAGPEAGRFAGRVRHNAGMTVFLPVDDVS
jgi:membrane-bound lytic murein transglycosylase A